MVSLYARVQDARILKLESTQERGHKNEQYGKGLYKSTVMDKMVLECNPHLGNKIFHYVEQCLAWWWAPRN